MRILMLLTNEFSPDMRVYKEALSLTELGHEVEIWCWDRESKFRDRPLETVEGFVVRRFFAKAEYGTGLSQAMAMLAFYRQALKASRGLNFDAVHAHDLDTLPLGILLKMRLRARLVYDEHDLFFLYFKERGKAWKPFVAAIKLAERILLRAVDVHITVSEEIKELYWRPGQPKEPLLVMNKPLLDRGIKTVKIESPKLRISYIGSVNYYDELRQLCLAGVARPEDCVVSIHGKGLDSARLSAEFADCPNICITGEFSPFEVFKFYEATDLLFACYPEEHAVYNLPNKFFEAVLTGTPVLTGRESALGRFLRMKGWGFELSPRDLCAELIALIDELRAKPSILKGISSAMLAEREEYSWDNNLPILKAVYPLTSAAHVSLSRAST